MTPLLPLITAIIRLLGLYFMLRAFDSAAQPLFYMVSMQATFEAQGLSYNSWTLFITMAVFYVGLALLIFFLAPRIARLIVGSGDYSEVSVPWNETLIFVSGAAIASFAIVRATETITRCLKTWPDGRHEFAPGEADLISLLITMLILGGGGLLMAKFHRIAKWMAKRRTNSEQDSCGQPATRPESK
jgi:hypothetical protein